MNIILKINTRLIKLTELGTQNSTAQRVFQQAYKCGGKSRNKYFITHLFFSAYIVCQYAYFPKSKTMHILFYDQNDFLSYLMIRRVDVWDKFVYN